jgi:EAL domain-containing protein (putative c-di-GMP-specific phosphodiesterase class I)
MPDANGNLIPPDVFIPVAEQLRLIDKVGAWVLRQACLAASTWPADLKVAVNLSVAQFTSGDITATVAAALQEANLNADRLELEITEGLLLNDDDQAYADLRALKSLGVSIVMDDFGTGYSSLGYLWRFPFDKIKVDKSFMNALQTPLKAELTAHRGANKIVSTILALARELRLQVTVEGVERADQLEFLDRVGASLIQGFLFSRPLPSADVPTYILTHFGKSMAMGDRRTSGEVAAPSQAA